MVKGHLMALIIYEEIQTKAMNIILAKMLFQN